MKTLTRAVWLALLALGCAAAAAGQERVIRNAAYRLPVLRMVPQQPHDPIFLRGKDEGSTQFTMGAGVVNIDLVGAGVSGSWNAGTNTWTVTIAGLTGVLSGTNDKDVLVNNAGAVDGVALASGKILCGDVTDTPAACNVALTPRADDDGTVVLAASDRGNMVTVGHATANAVSIAQAGTAGFESGYVTELLVTGAGPATITPATSTVNGAATLVANQYDAVKLVSDGTNYWATVSRRLFPEKRWFPLAACQNTTATLIWDTPTSNPAVAACVTGTNTQKGVADFADSADLSAQITLRLPSDWTSTGGVDVLLKWFTSATSGSVVWQVSTICVADAETDDPAFNTASTVTDAAKGTTLQTNDAAITGLTMTGCAAGELLHLKVQRDAAHGSDDLAATARLIGIELTWRRVI